MQKGKHGKVETDIKERNKGRESVMLGRKGRLEREQLKGKARYGVEDKVKAKTIQTGTYGKM